MFRWLATDFDVLPELFVTRPPEGGRPVVDSVRPRVVVAKSARAKKRPAHATTSSPTISNTYVLGELPLLGKFCCKPPDDDVQPNSKDPAWLPLPVPSDPWQV